MRQTAQLAEKDQHVIKVAWVDNAAKRVGLQRVMQQQPPRVQVPVAVVVEDKNKKSGAKVRNGTFAPVCFLFYIAI